MSKNNSIAVLRNGTDVHLGKFRIKEVENVVRGDYEVFIHAASGSFFDRLTAQLPNKSIESEKYAGRVNGCSWHGTFLRKDGKIECPKIHLKRGEQKLAWTQLDGVIDQSKIFLFPIFSLGIPGSFSSQNIKNKPVGAFQKLYIKPRDVRIDFFLLPKNISREKFEKLTVSKFFVNYDITMFNREARGALIPLDNCDVDCGWYKLNNTWAMIRCVYPNMAQVNEYYIYFHDTYDPLGCILDRGVSPSKNSAPSFPKELMKDGVAMMRDIHERELLEHGLK